ncbi:ribosomal protein S18-alanine N-acetyltransferase [Deferrisoma camini]|uniref:ribosomal protein S18-alanine N-acetyltransferase n=1 Tax=Deferrisoma camini TaxID=1035120 RepID=UPI00046CE5BB|nr:ribosomal protein S18-alanine N-acetyltransferase [Deferrisoma camini]
MADEEPVRIVEVPPARWMEVLRVESASFAHPWDPGTVHEVLHSRFCRALGAEAPDGSLVGHVLYAVQGGLCHVLDLAVLPGWRRRGIGTRLARAMLERLKAEGVEFSFLEVRASNAGAEAFYRSLGFEPVGRRPRYYPDTGEDAVVMVRLLAS